MNKINTLHNDTRLNINIGTHGFRPAVLVVMLAVAIVTAMLPQLAGRVYASTSQEDFDAYFADESYQGADDEHYNYYDYHDMDEDLSGTDFYVDPDYVPTFEGDEDTQDLQVLSDLLEGEKVRCRVTQVISEQSADVSPDEYAVIEHSQNLMVRIKEGDYKGQEVEVVYDLSDAWGGGNAPKPAKKGDLVICQFAVDAAGDLRGEVVQFGRERGLLALAIIFLVLLVLFGGKGGLRSIIALVVTCVGLIFIMIPAMVNGMNAVFAAICACIFAVAVTLTIMYGFTVKTLAAALGAWGGLIMAGVITAIMNAVMNMTGLVDDESMYLAQSVGDGSMDLRGILFAAILIGILGGTIDVGISIASALDELREKAGDSITGAEMMKSGINIGIDIMGASLNTLILSYVGGSIHLLMLYYTYDNPMVLVINDEMIACELLRSLAGSCGLLLTVPITSFVSALMMCRGNFGRFDPECFQIVALFRKLRGDKPVSAKPAKADRPSKPERRKPEPEPEIVPDDLFARAHRHLEELEADGFDADLGEDYPDGDISDDYFSTVGDFDDYDDFGTNK